MTNPSPALPHHQQYPILATGAALPSLTLSNADLAAELAKLGVETSSDWIESRTGIRQRHWCAENESTFTLALAAARQAIANAPQGFNPASLAAIVVATCTPDHTFPSVAAQLHGALADELNLAPGLFAADLNAACSGFLHALAVTQKLLQPGQTALVLGAERFSNLLDLHNRTTAVLFGDGAGAVLLGCEALPANQAPKGLLGVSVGVDGRLAPALMASGGPGTTRTAGVVQMQGGEVFKHAVRQMSTPPALLADHGLTLADVSWLVPHQANVRILNAAAENLGLPIEKLVVTVDQHANTSGASIPLALHTAKGKFQPGDLLLLQAFGAGFVWSTALIRW